MVIGTLKEHMAYIDIELNNEFSSVSLPVYDISDDVRDNILPNNLETSGVRSGTEGLVVPNDKPR
jgi:hypothetical protein